MKIVIVLLALLFTTFYSLIMLKDSQNWLFGKMVRTNIYELIGKSIIYTLWIILILGCIKLCIHYINF